MFFSSKAYKYIRSSNLLLLPSTSTLQKWIFGFTCKPGFCDTYLNLVGKTLQYSEEPFSNLGVICFDEMDILSSIQYHRGNKCVYGPAKKVQMVMVRGLVSPWKQVFYIEFNQNMTRDLFMQHVAMCEGFGIKIQAAVFDMGNHTFLSEFQILSGVNHTANPTDAERKIYFFPDTPHLLKLLRNHCLDKGFTLQDSDGSSVNLGKHEFEKLIMQDGKELKICPNLTYDLLNVRGSTRQRVRPAARLFSDTVSKGFLYHLGETHKIQSNFVLKVNNWFDVMNSRSEFSSSPHRAGFGINLEIQTSALHDMKKEVSEMRFSNNPSKLTKLPFQKGILISIESMLELYKELSRQGLRFILTSKLNQDCLENVFSKMRSLGTSHPGPADILTKMKLLLIGANVQGIVENPAVELEEETMITRSIATKVQIDYQVFILSH